MSHNASPDRQFWNEQAQTMPRDELRVLQDERLREAVHRAYEHAGFFRRRFDAAGVRPDDVKSVDDLQSLPPFVKNDLRANEAEVPPIGDYRGSGLGGSIRLATSTGTTGRPTFALWTRNDLDIEFELGSRNWWRSGWRPGDIVVNAHPGYLNGGQGLMAGIVEHMGCLSISIGPPESDEQLADVLRRLEDIPINRWLIMPAAAVWIRKVAAEIGWKQPPPPLDAAGPMRQLDLISAGMECIGNLGSTCKLGQGLGAHLAEDYAIVEAVDPVTHEPVADGERGYMLCTSLGRDNPMIRYNLEDVIRIESAECDCGETNRRGFWDGRGADVVDVAGRWVLPIDVWRHLPFDAEYLLVRRSRPMDRLEVRVEGPIPKDFVEKVETDTGVPVVAESIPEGSLAKASYKYVRVIDED